MIKSLYTAISGLQANNQQMSVIGDNIANEGTTGYKATKISFDSLVNPSSGSGYTGKEIGSGVILGDVSYNWSAGTIQQTSNSYDMAISGTGFFNVTDSSGKAYYTRDGSFKFDGSGNLVTAAGDNVQGYAITGGTTATTLSSIKIDPATYASVTVDSSGIYYGTTSTGTKTALFQIALYKPTDQSKMAKMSGNLYTDTSTTAGTSGIPGANGLGAVSPSSLEMSNVDIAQEFVNMITAQRAFSANAKVITSSDQILQDVINMKQ